MRSIAALVSLLCVLLAPAAWAAELKAGDSAPLFKTKTHTGKTFDLASRQGKWTILYFYPKSGTSGCTKEAQAYRDNTEAIRAAGADIFGISQDTVEVQDDFHKAQQLTFTLLADADGSVIDLYDTKMFGLNMSKRWTFLIGPDLKIRQVEHDVDPSQDATRVAAEIVRLKALEPGR